MPKQINQSIDIPHLGRVEGHGGIHVEITDGEISQVDMEIYEGSRYYEVLVVGKHFTDVPPIVSRVCAICSADHTLASQMAVEDAMGIEITPRTRLLRGLLLHGSMIESHALHVFALALPDLLGYPSLLAMVDDYPEQATIGLELKKLGNTVQEMIGGRAIHPVNAVVGGFGKIPSKDDLIHLADQLEHGLHDALKLVDLLGSLDLPDYSDETNIYAALHNAEERYSYLGHEIFTSTGERKPIHKFREICHERVVGHSTAKQSLYSDNPFMTGALARININGHLLEGKAKEVQEQLLSDLPNYNDLHNNTAQFIEIIHSLQRAHYLVQQLIQEPLDDENPIRKTGKSGVGVGALEAPRGTLYHYYEIDKAGVVTDADIITPTAQNLANIEKDFRTAVEQKIESSHDELKHQLEMIARAYDPCISCAVHLVDVMFRDEREGV
ncbi:MAG: Ni/Fe hydrogenase subunit alpha [Candidatus Marinimicrobia bacterium]|nr:Ni/Fe hydrogenase subunit alpha [Candidatus Neomarinimicrobiota bacterium]MCF7829967.1 Ni/Fe hydrogenase subunit alpha [Candidatus Neomarinimicrobiota bacterium]MCF7881879.1 Ni/Fe hydrogenase subunit alpha [Candidatus Neomarinimicrobiota bacterium]